MGTEILKIKGAMGIDNVCAESKIITCKDCRKYDTKGFVQTSKNGWCKELRRVVNGSFYCGHAERKGNDKR